jgi:ADP-heptose:LPS heptosyltransferase
MTHRVQYNAYLHTAVTYRLLVEALTRSPEEVPMLKVKTSEWPLEVPTFIPAPGEKGKLLALLEVLSPRGARRPIVLLNPNASDLMPLRRWPRGKFVALGRALLERHPDLTVVITGAPAEAVEAEALCTALGSPRAVCVAGKTTLRDLIVLYTISDVLVTNDSGPAHFSSMTDIHSVVLFGPETPSLFGALSPKTKILSAGLACSPCVSVYNHRSSACRDNQCMQAISVSEVLATIEAALDEREGREPSLPRPRVELPEGPGLPA